MSDDLREQIAEQIHNTYCPVNTSSWKYLSEERKEPVRKFVDRQILSLPEIAELLKAKKEGKIAVLDDDQSLPDLRWTHDFMAQYAPRAIETRIYHAAQLDMLKAGFRRVV